MRMIWYVVSRDIVELYVIMSFNSFLGRQIWSFDRVFYEEHDMDVSQKEKNKVTSLIIYQFLKNSFDKSGIIQN